MKNVCTGGHVPTGADTYRGIWRQIVCDQCAICRQILSRGDPKGGIGPSGTAVRDCSPF